MGFNRHSINLLLNLEKFGVHDVSFEDIVTIGRQGLHEPKKVLDKIFIEKGISVNDYNFCEEMLYNLSANKVDSIDFSDHERCSIVHDMNDEIPKKYCQNYSLVIDSGSSEHIFNFPNSIKNCMNLVKIGGHFIGVYPIDNLCGHGFYQFSPELFFRCFSEENGFKMIKVFIYQVKNKLNLFEIVDPNELTRRIYLRTSYPTMVFFVSKKLSVADIFKKSPQQSDYSTKWGENKLKKSVYFNRSVSSFVRKNFPISLRAVLKKKITQLLLIYRGMGILDKEGFKKIM